MKIKCTISIIILLSVTPLTLCLAQGGSWETRGEIPEIRGLHSASVVDGKIYLIGGVTSGSYPNGSSLVQVYDPLNGEWETKAPMLTPRSSVETCVLNEKIYAIGGQKIVDDPSQTSKKVEVYDPATDSWSSCANLIQPRISFGLAAVNGKIYAIGGMYLVSPCSDVWEYDPNTDTWVIKLGMPTPRNYIFACCSKNGKIYVFGGAKGASNDELNIVEEYDPVNNSWKTKRDMPTGIQHPRADRIDDKIYVMGGRKDLSGVGIDINLEYDPVENTWKEMNKMPVARVFHTISGVKEKIYVIGGTSDGDFSGAVLTIDVYTPPISSVGIEEKEKQSHPFSWELFQNYPNPFNPTTTINYSLVKGGDVKIMVYNTLGQVVAVLMDEYQSQGLHSVKWDAQELANGVYFYRLDIGGFSSVKKCLLLK